MLRSDSNDHFNQLKKLESGKTAYVTAVKTYRWNPIGGCTKYSDGCDNCYAERQAAWLHRIGNPRYVDNFKLTLHHDLLEQPLKWKKGKPIFVAMMSDLFHDDVPDDFIKRVFETMNKAQQHRFVVITKRAERLAEMSDELNWTDNIMAGVSVESRKYYHRIDLLRQTGAKYKYISMKPFLESMADIDLTGINWVLAGGESGDVNSRPLKADWIREIRDKCIAENVPLYFRQWGLKANNPDQDDPTIADRHSQGGKTLDGVVWTQYPDFFVM